MPTIGSIPTLTTVTAAAALAALLMGQSVSPAAAASGRSCNQAVGPAQAATYVSQCTQVSPATHPPCNAANSCALIISEIRRSCALIGAGAPSFCAAYRN
jgi:hypothetical protein